MPSSKTIEEKSTPVVARVDYAHLESLMDKGVELYAVTNTLKEPFIYDWNLELLPEDLEDEFNKYLEKKYIDYGKDSLIGRSRIVAIFEDGRTVNFLHSFLASKKFPVVLPRAAGKEQEYRSSFVLNAGTAVILTAKQAESLRALEKVKRVWEEADKKIESPWLGYLLITPIQKQEDLLKYSISYVTTKDTLSSHEDITELPVAREKRNAGIIKATK